MYELVNIFDMFLPQLLQYPNPKDPLNVDAASLFNSNLKQYNEKVRQYVEKYAMDHLKDTKMEIETEINFNKPVHKASASTNAEDLMTDDISHLSQLSDLSETSNIMLEEEML